MKFLNNLKHVAFAVLPLIVVVAVVDLFVFDIGNLLHFFIGAGALIIGETIVLVSIEESVVKMGALVAYSSRRRYGMVMVLLFALIFGVLSTMAEPDMQVLAGETNLLGVAVPRFVFVLIAGTGVGLFCSLGVFRTSLKLPIWVIMFIFYGAVIVLSFFTSSDKAAFAFDAGSASTGVVAAPFLIALCSGVGARRIGGGKEASFGLIGVTSIGPVLAVIMLLIFTRPGSASGVSLFNFNNVFASAAVSVFLAILPMVIVFFAFELCFFKISKQENVNILLSTGMLFVGLFLMISGLEFGFVGVGKNLGIALADRKLWFIVLLLASSFGFFFTFAEPAVRVLGGQVEETTRGNIKSKFVVLSIGVSMIVSAAISVLCVVLNWNISIVLVCILGFALALMAFAPPVFVAVAFDSGGVALGPTSTSFLFPMILGLSQSFGVASAFGTLALLGLVPCVVLQILGVVYAIKTKSILPAISARRRRAMLGVDKYSEIEKLEKNLRAKYGKEKK